MKRVISYIHFLGLPINSFLIRNTEYS